MNDYLEKGLSELNCFFGRDGLLSASKTDYEYREDQLKMALNVYKSLCKDKTMIVEAGTGIGKSFAYLAAVAVFVKYTDEVVVISTETKNLQAQLYNKDIRDVLNIMHLDIPYHLALGRNNYVCLRRTKENPISGVQYSRAEYCLNRKCKYVSECKYMINREKCMNSKIIICNHHLLFSDCNKRKERKEDYTVPCVLPAFQYLIIDEAHKIDISATNCISEELNFSSLSSEIEQAGNMKDDRSVNKKLSDLLITYGKKKNPEIYIDRLIKKYNLFTLSFADFTGCVYNLLSVNETVKTISQEHDFTETIQNSANKAVDSVSELLKCYDEILSCIKNTDENNSDIVEISAFHTHLFSVMNMIRSFFFNYNSENVYYVSRGEKNEMCIKISPIYAYDYLKDNFFPKLSSVIMTSATIALESDFSFFTKLVGLSDSDVYTYRYFSPFNLNTNMKMIISTDTDKNNPPSAKLLSDIILSSSGGALVLFTNTLVMRKMFDDVSPILRKSGIKAYCQGLSEVSNEFLLNSFREDDNSVLFGVDSFWEGVDVPGNSLRLVIIFKLPFSYVKDPIYEARKKNTDNFFRNYSLPCAVIKFKQGVGRLLRTEKDTGVVVVLDSDVLPSRSSYGLKFLSSVKNNEKPEIIVCNSADIPSEVKKAESGFRD